MPTPAEKRSACYAIIAIAKIEPDNAVKRVLASQALALAQEAQLQVWAENPVRLSARGTAWPS